MATTREPRDSRGPEHLRGHYDCMVFARRLGFAVVLGALTSVGLAWSLITKAAHVGTGSLLWQSSTDSFWMAGHDIGRGWDQLMLFPAAGITEAGAAMAEPLPSWCLPPDIGRSHARNDAGLVVEACGAGWPLRCVFGYRIGSDDSEAHFARTGTSSTGLGPAAVIWEERRGTLVFRDPPSTSRVRGLLPWYVIPHGLAVNTSLLALPWLAILHVGAARRLVRRRRGRCPACGYALQGGTTARCPECGAPVSAIAPA